jgi:hypothetical protein
MKLSLTIGQEICFNSPALTNKTMEPAPTLVESLLPVRNRLVRDESVGSYDVSSQTRRFSVDGLRLPGEVRASDGGSDGIKLTDKGIDGSPCWVAREVYGVSNPSWQMFREWLLNDSPVWFRSLYLARGESFARWISNKPVLKAIIRHWMDRRIQARPLRASC